MHKFLSMAAVAAFSMMLAACGGDSSFKGSGSSGGSATGGTVTTLSVSSDVASIPSDGTLPANITVIAKDANAAVVSGASVSFAVSTGGTITATQSTTDSSGAAKATLVAASSAAGTTLTVTATSGTVTGTTTVSVAAIQKTVTLLTNSSQIPSDNSAGATISAVVKDANNNLLAGVPVSFQVTSGAIAPIKTSTTSTVTAGTTDANGLAQAVVSTPGDSSNRTITVNAAAGGATSSLTLSVTGTTLSLTGPANLVQNSTGTCTVVLQDSSGHGVGNTSVMLTSANNNTLSAQSLVTDASGRGTFTVKGTVGGTDTITAVGLGLTQKISIPVSTQSFNITAPADGTKVNLGASQQLTVTWTNSGAPVVNQPVTFATTRGTLGVTTPVNTDANGQAQIAISSTSSGPAIIQATASGVTAQLNLDFIATTPSQVALQSSAAAVAIQGQSTLTAQVRDANNNLVEGATVSFHVTADPTNGGLSVASAVTDAQGRAQSVYTAGNTSSGANGVVISATVGAVTPATTQITVGGQTVNLSLGTGNTIDVSQGPAVYQVTYTVFATDAHSAGIANVPVTVSMLPVAYGKGVMVGCVAGTGTGWVPSYSTATSDTFAFKASKTCVNEDTDYTSNISSGDVAGAPVTTCMNLASNSATITSHAKDYNCNGMLDPGNVATVSPSSGVTDSTGRLDIKVTYPRDHAYWVEEMLVAATAVQGTQSSTSTTFMLQGAVPDYACATAPPGATSPYGTAATCADPR